MKTPDRIIIDLDTNSVLIGRGLSVSVFDDVPQLTYCQNDTSQGIEISISIKLSYDKSQTKGIDASELNAVVEEVISSSNDTGITNNEVNDKENTKIDTELIDDMFDDMYNNPGDDVLALQLVKYNREGLELEIFNYKQELFRQAFSNTTLSQEQYNWLKKNKIRLLNSKRNLNI